MAGQVAGEGLLLLEGDEHKQAKKAFNHSFQPQRINLVYPQFYKMAYHMQNMVSEQLENESAKGQASVLKPVSAATLDAVGQWAYSKDFKALTNPRERFPRSYIEMLKMTPRGQKFLRLIALIGPKAMQLPFRAPKTITGVVQYVIKTSTDIVESREALFEQAKENPGVEIPDDMLSSIMKTGHFSHVELINETVHFLAASTETSAGSICWAVHILSRHLDVQARLREEIRTHLPSPAAVANGEVDESRVSYQIFDKMPYLQAVAKEVFRFHSINSLLWREAVEPATIADEHIPVGTKVVFSPWASGRDPAHWGADSRQFKPERWLNSPNGGADDSYAFLTFGAGPRRCIGEQYAYAQFKTFLAALIGRFEFKTLNPQGSDVGMEIGNNYALTLFKIMDGWKTYVKEVEGW
ncbi:Cytochrome P450-like protein 16 [Elsinoe fawcettii]|nr:Cytochrome P450-like protein 16 [Elsinoe fawcettii]